jgi:hypothetical protein
LHRVYFDLTLQGGEKGILNLIEPRLNALIGHDFITLHISVDAKSPFDAFDKLFHPPCVDLLEFFRIIANL